MNENEITEKIEKTNTERIISDNTDHEAVYQFATIDLLKNEQILEELKKNLLKIRESGNLSVRQTQKVLTPLCKTIRSLSEYRTYVNETAYKIEHASEINEEKRALRDFIKTATPEQMAAFRMFLKTAKSEKSEKSEKP